MGLGNAVEIGLGNAVAYGPVTVVHLGEFGDYRVQGYGILNSKQLYFKRKVPFYSQAVSPRPHLSLLLLETEDYCGNSYVAGCNQCEKQRPHIGPEIQSETEELPEHHLQAEQLEEGHHYEQGVGNHHQQREEDIPARAEEIQIQGRIEYE